MIGRTPRCRWIRTSARTLPAARARSSALFQGLSMRYPSLVRTTRSSVQVAMHEDDDELMGHCRAVIRADMTVACRTVIPICERTSCVMIFNADPVSRIISGSHRTLNTSPTMGSRTLKGNRTSSWMPFMNLANGI